MNTLFSDFPKISKEKWEEKLIKELKGVDFTSSLIRNDEMEDLIYSTYSHKSDQSSSNEIPGRFPFKRGFKSIDNDWYIASLINVEEEKDANSKAMGFLMTGCTSLVFDLKKRDINCNLLFNEIGFEFIQAQFVVYYLDQYQLLLNYFKGKENLAILFRLDFFSTDNLLNEFNDFVKLSIGENKKFCHVNSFGLQQCGGNSIQEISFGLSCGHEYLVKLMQCGYSIDQAASSIHFSLGIGSNYFYEIAKIRAFRKLWSKIVKSYDPVNSTSMICHITSEVGHMNKSLKDPYTNLLRQTTEAMSAISAGVETLLVHPYDSKSIDGISVLSSRMALNISLILKDESYFDKVIDPIGGSYSIELLTEQIAEKSWKRFQKLDGGGGILSTETFELLKNEVLEKSQMRIDGIKSGKQMIIGVNKFLNSQIESNSWLPDESFFGMKKIIFERDI